MFNDRWNVGGDDKKNDACNNTRLHYNEENKTKNAGIFLPLIVCRLIPIPIPHIEQITFNCLHILLKNDITIIRHWIMWNDILFAAPTELKLKKRSNSTESVLCDGSKRWLIMEQKPYGTPSFLVNGNFVSPAYSNSMCLYTVSCWIYYLLAFGLLFWLFRQRHNNLIIQMNSIN